MSRQDRHQPDYYDHEQYTDLGTPKRKRRRRWTLVALELGALALLVLAGWRLLQGGSPPDDREGTERVPTVSPITADAVFERALLYYEQGDYDQALEDFTHVLEAEHRVTEAYYRRARTYYALDLYADAIEDYSRYLTLDAECDLALCNEAYNNRGLSFYLRRPSDPATRQYFRDLAIDDFSQAIAIEPEQEIPYRHRALVHADMGDAQAAMRDWQTILALRDGPVIQRGLPPTGGVREAEISEPAMRVDFSFDGEPGWRVAAEVASDDDLDLMMFLQDQEGRMLAFGDDEIDETHDPRIEAFTLTEAGVYTWVVVAYRPDESGAFTLTMSAVAPEPVAVPTLTPNDPASGINEELEVTNEELEVTNEEAEVTEE